MSKVPIILYTLDIIYKVTYYKLRQNPYFSRKTFITYKKKEALFID